MNEELWYSEFGLRKNSFAVSDREKEMNRNEDYMPIETEATRLVERQIRSGGYTIIVGPKGCGKTTTVVYIKMKRGDAKMMNGKWDVVPIVAGSKSLRELVLELFDISMLGLGNDEMDQLDNLYSRILKDWFEPKPQKQRERPSRPWYICEFGQCPRGHRCVFPQFNSKSDITFRSVVSELKLSVSKKEIDCPLMRWVTARLFDHRIKQYDYFLLDVHDEMGKDTKMRYFREFVRDLAESSLATFILMATSHQFHVLQKSDYFARWKKRKFPSMTVDELRKIYEGRLEYVRDPQIKYPDPLSEDAFNHIAVASAFNPRGMILNVGLVLDIMLEQGCAETVDMKFVVNVFKKSGTPVYVDPDDALDAVLHDLYNKDVKEVWNDDLLARLKRLGVEGLKPNALGKKMSARNRKGYDKKVKDRRGTAYRIR